MDSLVEDFEVSLNYFIFNINYFYVKNSLEKRLRKLSFRNMDKNKNYL